MLKKLAIVVVALFAFGVVSEAKDLGFRYKNGKCVNDAGMEGLNVGYIGQCSDLRGVVMSRFVLDDMDLQGSNFENADLQNTSMKRTNLSNTYCAMTNFSGVDFEGAILHNVNLSGSLLINSHLADADLLNVDLSKVDFSNSTLSYFKCAGCNMAGAKLINAVMDHADLSGMDFSGGELSGANLQDSMLDGTKFDGAVMNGVNMTNSSLVGVSAVKASARRATFRQANLKGAKLQEIQLGSAQLDNANLEKASLKNADLRAAVLTGAKYSGADFSGAKYSRRTMLPFSKDDARKYGMVEGSGGIFILWDLEVTTQDVVDVKSFLEGQGIDVKLSAQGHNAFDGTENIGEYDALLHFYGIGYQRNLGNGAQNALVEYVNKGGTYIGTAWSGFGYNQNGNFKLMKDLIFIPYDNYSTSAQIAPAPGKEKHPLTTGIAFPATVTGYFSTAANFMAADKGTDTEAVLIDSSNNKVAGVRKLGLGLVVNFAFVPDSDYRIFNQKVPLQLILNALEL